MDWRKHIESNTGEVAVWAVAASLGIPRNNVMEFVKMRHGARYVGGLSHFLIWSDDADELETFTKEGSRS